MSIQISEKAVQISSMSVDDLSQVLVIEELSYPIPWSLSLFEKSLLSSDECWVLRQNGSIVGFTIISNILDEAHLLNICIHPNTMGKGLGRHLLKFVIQKAISRQANMFFLEVRVSNQAAIDLYFTEGFNEVGVRPNYYPSKKGREDALLMTLELSVDQYI